MYYVYLNTPCKWIRGFWLDNKLNMENTLEIANKHDYQTNELNTLLNLFDTILWKFIRFRTSSMHYFMLERAFVSWKTTLESAAFPTKHL